MNQGSVIYKKTDKPGQLNAIWCHADSGIGKGIATGGPADGFVGDYEITYFDSEGNVNAVRDLKIEAVKDYFQITWLNNGKPTAEGIGMEVNGELICGWRNIKND